MKVRFLRLSSFVVLVQLAVSIHAIRTCSLVENHSQATFLPDPDNCRKFVVCVHGVAVSRYCPSGLHWNSLASTCDYPARAKCKILNSVVEQTIKVVAEKPVQSLANGEINPLCSRGDNPWAYLQLAYPKDCTKFLKCSNGRIWIFECPKGLQWNIVRNRCDYPINEKISTSEMQEKISLVGLISTSATTKNKITKMELPADTIKEFHITESTEFGTSPLMREKLSEQSSTTISIFEEQHRLLNIDDNQSVRTMPLSTDFENFVFTDDTSKKIQLLESTRTLMVEKTTELPEKTVVIGNTDITRISSEETTIISDLKDFIMEHHNTIQPESHITVIQDTTIFSKDQTPEQSQTNINRLIAKSTNTTINFEQTTSIPQEITIAQYDTTSAMKIKSHDSTLELIEQPIKKAPAKIHDYEDITKKRKFKAVADTSLLLFGLTANRTLPMTLSKTSKDVHSSPSNTTDGVQKETLNSTNSQEKTTLHTSSTEPAITTTTFDPRLPFKAVECEGINNEERFSTTDCRKYYQCLNGFAYLLNCFEGYAFSADQKICILSDFCVD